MIFTFILIYRKVIAFVNVIATILSGHCVTPSPQLWRGQDGYNMLMPQSSNASARYFGYAQYDRKQRERVKKTNFCVSFLYEQPSVARKRTHKKTTLRKTQGRLIFNLKSNYLLLLARSSAIETPPSDSSFHSLTPPSSTESVLGFLDL